LAAEFRAASSFSEARPAAAKDLSRPAGGGPEPSAGGDDGGLAAEMKAVAALIGARCRGVMAGLKGIYAARIAAARRSGLSRPQIEAIIQGIIQEQQAAMTAATGRAAMEIAGLTETIKTRRQVVTVRSGYRR